MSPGAPSFAVRFEAVSAGYGGRTVLENATLSLPRGGILGLIGPNGSGKSTVLRLILGQLAPRTGVVEVLGGPPRQARTRVGYVPQSLALERDLPVTVQDLVESGFLGLGSPSGGIDRLQRSRARDWVAKLGLEKVAGRRLSDLSGGQLQLALVARALVREPELLLLDEPTANADSRAEGTVFSLLEECCRDRTGIVVSHDIGVLSRNVGSIACVGAGKIVHHGGSELPLDALEEAYGCPVDLIAHGHPHRVLPHHDGDSCGHHHGTPRP
ncbi:MAG: ATP-binding cassette domain-containing protein [Fibrobacteria bacterium]|nr:ATP-binding cassette domain-containing protein [Fibrobacteria bacterium]